MTILIHFQDLDIIIADVLLTIDVKGPWTLPLPSVEDASRFAALTKFHPSRLVRKYTRIPFRGNTSKFFIVGTVRLIDQLWENFDKIAHSQMIPEGNAFIDVDRSNVISVLQASANMLHIEDRKEVGLIGIRGESYYSTADIESGSESQLSFPYFGRVNVLGSAKYYVQQLLQQMGYSYDSLYKTETLKQKLERVSNNLPMQLMQCDRSQAPVTLLNGVGGYYEVYVAPNGNFVPLDRTVTLFAELRADGDDWCLHVSGFWYHQYEGDALLVIAIPAADIMIGKDKVFIGTSDISGFRISPYRLDFSEQDVSLRALAGGLRNPRRCRSLITAPELLKKGSMALVGRSADLLHMEVTDDGMSITLKHSAMDELLESVKQTAAVAKQQQSDR